MFFRYLLLISLLQAVHPASFFPPIIKQKYYEIRGAWVATVSNIDFPQIRSTEAYEEHKNELKSIVENAKNLGLNTIYFQIRPNSDAFYKSKYECWSYYYTNLEGKAPNNEKDDPLKMILEYGQIYGIDVHAWFNPYRSTRSEIADDPKKSICVNQTMQQRFPDCSFEYPENSGSNYGDPGCPEIQDYIVNVMEDLIQKYGPNGTELVNPSIIKLRPGQTVKPIVGLHMDDYFYPYPSRDSNGQLIPLPDTKTFEKYNNGPTPFTNIDDWRRENVNIFVEKMHNMAKSYNVLMGISPFGIYKTGQPAKIKGMSSPDEIFADTRAWLDRNIVDYLAPQLYWQDMPQDQSSTALLDFWTSEEVNPHKIPVLIGLASYRVDPINSCPNYSQGEIATQIEICREEFELCFGHIHFSYKYLKSDYKMRTSCGSSSKTFSPSLGSTFIDFENVNPKTLSETNFFSFFKQSSYNFNRATAVASFYNPSDFSKIYSDSDAPFDFQKELATGIYKKSSNVIQISVDRLDQPSNLTPDQLAVFMDFGKMLGVYNIVKINFEENDDSNSYACNVVLESASRQVIECQLDYLLEWMPKSEANKMDWTVRLIYEDYFYRTKVMSENLISCQNTQ